MLVVLMLINYTYTYDHLFARIGTDRVHWSTVISRLDDSVPPTDPHIARYFSIHRLAIQVKNWELAGSESYVYSCVGRGFELRIVDSLSVDSVWWGTERQVGD